jgi:P-type Cu+ transporter
LLNLTPSPIDVHVSVVTQTVTVRHNLNLPPASIRFAIDDAGFDVVAPPDETEAMSPIATGISTLKARRHAKHVKQCIQCRTSQDSPKITVYPHRVVLSVGGMTCASCSNTITTSVSRLPGVSEVTVDLLGNSAVVIVDDTSHVGVIVETIEDSGYEAEVVSVEPTASEPPKRGNQPHKNSDGPFNLTLSVGGMTCSSCTNTVTSIANDIPGVSEVAVSLIGKSATALIQRKDLADQLVQNIEDAGYEAEIISIEPIQGLLDAKVDHRIVELRVEGMFCE